MMYEELIAILGVLGIGSLVATTLTYIFDKRKRIKLNEQQLKESRYKNILAKMCSYLNAEYSDYIRWEGPKPANLKKELELEWFYSLVFASDDFVKGLKEFIQKPNNATYAKTVIAMRKDLWNRKTKLDVETFSLD